MNITMSIDELSALIKESYIHGKQNMYDANFKVWHDKIIKKYRRRINNEKREEVMLGKNEW